jgi:hypothetical protein
MYVILYYNIIYYVITKNKVNIFYFIVGVGFIFQLNIDMCKKMSTAAHFA